MKLVLGLGNYGDKYAYTYHNMGFLAAECLADRLGLKFKKRECDAEVIVTSYEGDKLVIARPLTYMNLSGRAAKQLLKKYDCALADMIVVFDDIDLERGTVRVRPSGSGGTHNGMRNIIECVGSGEFPRVRIGIGRPPEYMNLADYVLSEVPRADRETVGAAIERAVDEVEKLLQQKRP